MTGFKRILGSILNNHFFTFCAKFKIKYNFRKEMAPLESTGLNLLKMGESAKGRALDFSDLKAPVRSLSLQKSTAGVGPKSRRKRGP